MHKNTEEWRAVNEYNIFLNFKQSKVQFNTKQGQKVIHKNVS